MLFEEKKSFFTELKESGHNIVWAELASFFSFFASTWPRSFDTIRGDLKGF
jgi:hypothetical protein